MSMVVTDLDGTLLDARGRLGEANRRALERLGDKGVLRVVATGRSPYSALSVLAADFPIDYLVFSSGAGVFTWPERELLAAHAMDEAQVRNALAGLLARDLDFMVHFAVPENHRFVYRRATRAGAPNADFERRCERYRAFARPWDGAELADAGISQLLAVEMPGAASHYEGLARELADLNVVLTTSPLDHRSRWIEIFPPAASKSLASEWIRERHAVARDAVVAIGNDYNDRDLLDWASRAHVVANAPPPMRARYAVVASHDRGGFAEAVADL